MSRLEEDLKKFRQIRNETLLGYFLDDADDLYALARLIEDKHVLSHKMIQLVVDNIQRFAENIRHDCIDVYDEMVYERKNEEKEKEIEMDKNDS